MGCRLAPENRFPAALNDAYAVLTWAAEHADDLGVDPERIAVGGHSADAGLAAAVALRAGDEQGPPVRFQLLSQPGLDDRQETWSVRNFTDTPWMNRDKIAAIWGHYLGGAPATPYATPARATDLSGLPPAYEAPPGHAAGSRRGRVTGRGSGRPPRVTVARVPSGWQGGGSVGRPAGPGGVRRRGHGDSWAR
ncbi:alpha/beta hydrolase fold domain-containing protein [Streptomyces sp. G5(2025)]|uniref:alpha/beta hydrolase fold domain-containing protein n=1 Tax=Streptomyces sp. G5(2025) TaxID=3406628 RepID=UPI003C14D0DC